MSGTQQRLRCGRSLGTVLQGFPCIFANVVISSLHFLSARVSVIMLKLCKLWDSLCVDVGFFFSFFDWKEAEVLGKGSP